VINRYITAYSDELQHLDTPSPYRAMAVTSVVVGGIVTGETLVDARGPINVDLYCCAGVRGWWQEGTVVVVQGIVLSKDETGPFILADSLWRLEDLHDPAAFAAEIAASVPFTRRLAAPQAPA